MLDYNYTTMVRLWVLLPVAANSQCARGPYQGRMRVKRTPKETETITMPVCYLRSGAMVVRSINFNFSRPYDAIPQLLEEFQRLQQLSNVESVPQAAESFRTMALSCEQPSNTHKELHLLWGCEWSVRRHSKQSVGPHLSRKSSQLEAPHELRAICTCERRS